MTFAQFVGDGKSGIIGVLNTVVMPFIVAFAFFVFVWGVLKYFFFTNQGDVAKLKDGRQFIFWGIFGLVVLFSMWGFINLLLSTLGIMPTS